MAFPPILRLCKLNWLRYAAARKTLKHLSDGPSRKLFMRHVRKQLSFTRLAVPTDAGAPPVELRIRELHDKPIWCRSGLSDLGVVYDTFEGQYHLPPPDLRPVRAILDLGSNIGLTIAHLAEAYPEARILGVELDRGNFELCRRNIESYGDRCEVLHGAVWHEAGEVPYGGGRESGYAVNLAPGAQVRATAPALTVDSLIERLGVNEIDYVKMDIEGAEKEVLRNAGSWLPRVRCIKVEVHPEKASTLYTMAMCVGDLERCGMHCEIDARHHACILGRRADAD